MLEVKVVETKKNDTTYRDLVVIINGRDFILKPAPFYSVRARCLFNYALSTLPLSNNDKEQ
jgi:hypothetical protein